MYLTCPSSNSYAVAVDPECSEALERLLRSRGEIILDSGNLIGAKLGEARILYIRPSRLHVTLPREIDGEEFVENLLREALVGHG